MKCAACGYEELFIPAEFDWMEPEIDNTPFYESTLSLTIDTKRNKYEYCRLKNLKVYVCPKCGTLKIKRGEIE